MGSSGSMHAELPPIASIEGLTIAYPGLDDTVVAVRDLSLSIAPGEILGLTGEAACGKTTAALALVGAVRPPGRVVAGSARVGGQDLLGLTREALRGIRGTQVAM